MLEEEIDLRPYIEAILNKWYWIIIVGLVVAVLTFIITSLRSPQYEATALVTIIESNDVIEFDPRFRETAETQPLNAFPELATSDAVLNLVLDGSNIPQIENIRQLSQHLSVAQGADRSLLLFTVTNQEPEIASKLANDWATKFVQWANNVYTEQNAEEAVFFRTQLETAQENLATAEEELVNYQSLNQSGTISNTLTIYYDTQRAYLQEEQTLIALRQDVEALQAQLLAMGNDNSSFVSELTTLSLQLRAYRAENALPIILTAPSTLDASNMSSADQIAFLDTLDETLATRSTLVTEELARLAHDILQLQQQLQQSETEFFRLSRSVKVAEDTYLALSTKVQETQISSQDVPQTVRLVSEANIPQEPLGRGRVLYTIVGFVLGVGAYLILIVFTQWRREYRHAS